jgi:hypothetical protein
VSFAKSKGKVTVSTRWLLYTFNFMKNVVEDCDINLSVVLKVVLEGEEILLRAGGGGNIGEFRLL